MNGNAPNCSLTGSQTERLRNPKPNFANGSFELIAISTMIKTARAAIRTAKKPVAHLNNGSPIRGRALRLEGARPNCKVGWFGVSEDAEPPPASDCPMVQVRRAFSTQRRKGPQSSLTLLARSKRLALVSDRLDLLLGFRCDLCRQRGVEQRFGHLLAVVYCPPQKVHQRRSLGLIILVFIDKEVSERRDGIRIPARRVGN